MAELNRIKMNLLEDYNSLSDKHLANYFNNPRIRRHLLQAGLVRQNGELVSAKDYKARLLEEQRWLASQAFLAQAIVQRALDLEFSRRAQLQRQLEEVIRLELVERVRSARRKTGSAHTSNSENNRKWSRITSAKSQEQISNSGETQYSASSQNFTDHSPANESDCFNSNALHSSQSESGSIEYEERDDSPDFSYNHRKAQDRPYSTTGRLRIVEAESSPYLLPTVHRNQKHGNRSQSAPYRLSRSTNLNNKRGLLLFQKQRELSPGPKNVQYSCCDMTLRFLGTRMFISKNVNGGRQEVLVRQQMSGGNPVIVFFQPLLPGSTFTFTSRRYYDFPLSITVHVDGLVALRLSACCEYKYQIGRRLGGFRGYFVLVNISGQSLCINCNKKKASTPFLPPVLKHNTVYSTTKPVLRIKPTWSQSEENKKISFIAPIQRQSTEENSYYVDSKRSNAQFRRQSSLEDNSFSEFQNDIISLQNANSSSIILNEQEKNEVEEDIPELQTDTLVQAQDSKSEEIEECIGIQPSDEEIYSEDTEGSSTEDTEEASYTDKTSNSVSESCKSNESHEQEAEGPEITVTRPDTDESGTSASQHSSETESGSETQSSIEEDGKASQQFLKPDDARKISSQQKKSELSTPTRSTPSTNKSKKGEEMTDVIDSLNSKHVTVIEKDQELNNVTLNDRYDSSDEEETRTAALTTVVTADVHVIPDSSGELSKASSECEISKSNVDKIIEDNANEVEEPSPSDNDAHLSVETNNSSNVDSNIESSLTNIQKEKPRQRSYSIDTMEDPTEIELDGENLTESQIEELCDVIVKSNNLEILTLHKCGIHDLSIIPIANALIQSLCPLKSLNLNLNHLGPQAGPQIVHIIESKQTLQELFLHGNPIHDSGLCPIAEALLHLNLAQKNPEEGGLQRLDVGDCNFRNEGATSLASLIEQSPSLTTLILTGNNQLKHEEWSSIFWAVSQSSTITVLLLDYCALGDKGIDVFVKEIPYHPSLKEIDLEGNDITDEGGLSLLNWIRVNMTVNELRMERGNNIKETIMVDIIKILDNRRI